MRDKVWGDKDVEVEQKLKEVVEKVTWFISLGYLEGQEDNTGWLTNFSGIFPFGVIIC